MPGHWQRYTNDQQIMHDSDRIEELVRSHDVVYLLTDNRESRWLPTVLAQKHNKICFSVALGYDSYSIIRHGNYSEDSKLERNGCYFCNDVVAPTDSVSDRTLDQQCTVTRPGVAQVASGLACELLVSLVSHPLGKYAPAMDSSRPEQSQSMHGYLGYVPQYLRGNVYDYSLMTLNSKAYSSCVACSPSIVASAHDLPLFLPEVLRNPDHL